MLKKLSTGIDGLDQITNGGLPMGRTTLIEGESGSGKTVMALQILVSGARNLKQADQFEKQQAARSTQKYQAKVNAEIGDLTQRIKQLQQDIEHKRTEVADSKITEDHLNAQTDEVASQVRTKRFADRQNDDQ